MEDGYKTPKEQSPVKDCPPAPVKDCSVEKEHSSTYVVFDGNTGNSHKPMCLGTFMGALEAYHRGMQLSDEDKECLTNAGYKI